MDYSLLFNGLFQDVLYKEQMWFIVSNERIVHAIQKMGSAYKPLPKEAKLAAESENDVDYSDPAFRCAYLHKYAACYSAMTFQIVKNILSNADNIYYYFNSKKTLNLCSLGGGPGTDVIAMQAALFACFSIPVCSATIIDLAENWNETFNSALLELQSGSYGVVGQAFLPEFFNFQYLGADLKDDIAWNLCIRNVIMSADVITMVKFISSTASVNAKRILKGICECMKPGAMLLFIDNSAGGFHELVQEISEENDFRTVFGPLLHYFYEDSRLSVRQFGYVRQSKAKVNVHMWQKPKEIVQNSWNNWSTKELYSDFS
ncbi:hypothetical protein X975_02998, partial [Stegodyphus mimosarum]